MSVLTSINPANGDVVWQQPETSSDEFQDALTLARKTFEDWGFRPFDERASIVKAFSAGLEAEKENLATLISQEMGKPLWDSLGEVTAMINKAQISINAYHERTGQKESVNNGIRAALEHRPHGVMAVFGPYNFPGHLPNGHIVPALLAGNVVLFKPSELTPAVADATLAIWRKAGLPEGVLQLINGGPDTGRALVQSPEIDGVLFTGSVPTGRAIARTLADRPHVSLALELGGNNPLIVCGVDDLDAASL
ncbi:MAG: aldehyde dehydrogenase family protein, partial [Sphingomonadales bacterium]|nr:aldehyde dehydrogenase family protein [Sphingomonadales bacterium]